MAYLGALKHLGWPIRTTTGEVVEGDAADGEEIGERFRCLLFIPQGSEDAGRRGRQVTSPTLLLPRVDDAGAPVVIKGDDAVRVLAPELNATQGLGPTIALAWQLVGDPQPFGKPGRPVIGMQATVRRVRD